MKKTVNAPQVAAAAMPEEKAGRLLLRKMKLPSFWVEKGGRVVLYACLICISYVFLYPFIYMIITSLMSMTDLVDAAVQWIPSGFYTQNYADAWRGLSFPLHFLNSAVVALGATAGHLLSCSLVGYGFARYRSRFTDVMFVVVLLVMIVPVQTTIVSTYMMYHNFGWLDTFVPLIVPAFFGFGLRGSLFIFIFRQNFMGMPKELEEAAFIDGCGKLRTFFRVALPIAQPSLLVTMILSIVWHWNDYVEPNYYITDQTKKMLPTLLSNLHKLAVGAGQSLYNADEFVYTMGTAMAGAFLVLLPILVFYLIFQRQFVTSVERTGLVG